MISLKLKILFALVLIFSGALVYFLIRDKLPSSSTIVRSFLKSLQNPGNSYPGNVGAWTVAENENDPCISLRAAIRLKVKYIEISNVTWSANVDVPPTAKANGTCSTTHSTLILTWPSLTHLENNTLAITFQKCGNNSSQCSGEHYAVVQVSAKLWQDEETFFNSANPDTPIVIQETVNAFPTFLNRSYKCFYGASIQTEKLTVAARDLQFEAFESTKTAPAGKFSDHEYCQQEYWVLLPFALVCQLVSVFIPVFCRFPRFKSVSKSSTSFS